MILCTVLSLYNRIQNIPTFKTEEVIIIFTLKILIEKKDVFLKKKKFFLIFFKFLMLIQLEHIFTFKMHYLDFQYHF